MKAILPIILLALFSLPKVEDTVIESQPADSTCLYWDTFWHMESICDQLDFYDSMSVNNRIDYECWGKIIDYLADTSGIAHTANKSQFGYYYSGDDRLNDIRKWRQHFGCENGIKISHDSIMKMNTSRHDCKILDKYNSYPDYCDRLYFIEFVYDSDMRVLNSCFHKMIENMEKTTNIKSSMVGTWAGYIYTFPADLDKDINKWFNYFMCE